MQAPALPPMRIVFFTSLDSASVNGILELLTYLGQQVLLVVMTPGPAARPTTAYKDVVANIAPGYDTLVTSHIKRLPDMLRGLEPDLILVSGFPRLLPPELLSLPKLGSVNVHPALLPRHRGPDPIFWTLMDGDTEVGLTIHRMSADFDTGAILAQGAAPLGPDENAEDAFSKLLPLGGELLVAALAKVAAGDPGQPQSETGASYARLRTDADRLLDWGKSARQLHNQVRAWGAMGAIGVIDNRQVLIRHTHLVAGAAPGEFAPGAVVADDDQGLIVQTGAGLLRLATVPLPRAQQAV